MTEHVTVGLLTGFLDAFNRHDLDAIMGYFADDCVLYMPRGSTPRGNRYTGKAEVRAGLATRFAGLPDVHYGDARHWACGDFGQASRAGLATPGCAARQLDRIPLQSPIRSRRHVATP